MSTFENKNSLRTIEAQIVQKLKNNEARPKFTGSYKKACTHRTSTVTKPRLMSAFTPSRRKCETLGGNFENLGAL